VCNGDISPIPQCIHGMCGEKLDISVWSIKVESVVYFFGDVQSRVLRCSVINVFKPDAILLCGKTIYALPQ